MVEEDHDGDIASITIELLNVIEKLRLFFCQQQNASNIFLL